MCVRYEVDRSVQFMDNICAAAMFSAYAAGIALVKNGEAEETSPLPEFQAPIADSWQTRAEVSPGQDAPILLKTGSRLVASMGIWGREAAGESSPVASVPAKSMEKDYKDAFFRHRCVIPSTGFFFGGTLKYRRKLRRYIPGQSRLYMAGLYLQEKDADTPRFVLLQREPNSSIADICPQMPLVLRTENLPKWLGATWEAEMLMKAHLPSLSRENCDVQLSWFESLQ